MWLRVMQIRPWPRICWAGRQSAVAKRDVPGCLALAAVPVRQLIPSYGYLRNRGYSGLFRFLCSLACALRFQSCEGQALACRRSGHDRGPRSLETLRYVRNLGQAATIVLGNRDLSLLMAAEGFGKRSKGDTYDLEFCKRRIAMDCSIGCGISACVMSRATIAGACQPCHWTVTKAQELATEVEMALRGLHWRGSWPICGVANPLHGKPI